MEILSATDLKNMVQSVFPKIAQDRKLAFLVDIPNQKEEDNVDWQTRRAMAFNWFTTLKPYSGELGFEEISLIGYSSVGSNNADLPETGFIIDRSLPQLSSHLTRHGTARSFSFLFEEFQLFIAPTEFSTTAPLKNAAKAFGFRAATMPGFCSKMIPALRLDFNEVSRRVSLIKEKVDRAEWARTLFKVKNHPNCEMIFDLRFRKGHLSAGQLPEKGTAGNAPSGETYIVPYEGEIQGEPSKTKGTLPVQIGADLLFFRIDENRAVEVTSPTNNKSLELERDHLLREPAYGNMSELGFGVLGDFGLQPIGEILLDEKLGFHVAFGRSDHFGGQIGPAQFSSPSEVIHLDRIYIPACQPDIKIEAVQFGYEDQTTENIILNGQYLIF